MKSFHFIFQYLLNPRKVGAVLPSSKYLAEKMLDGIDFHNAKYIVELGPGTGVFTEKIIKNRIQHTFVMLIESNKEFCTLLKEKYKDEKNLIIINGSAEELDKYTKDFNIPYLDYVVSGLPFAILPKNVSSTILNKTKKMLRKNGVFITFQYTLLKKDFIHQYFKHIHITGEYRNMPPAYVFRCSNQSVESNLLTRKNKMTTNRVTFIDALRGFSLLGILLANLLSFQYGITGTIETKDLSALFWQDPLVEEVIQQMAHQKIIAEMFDLLHPIGQFLT